MKRRKILLLILLIPLILVVADYINFRITRIENIYHNDFKDNLYKITQDNEQFKMREVTNFKWDKMYIVAPYTSKSEMEEIVGKKWTTSNTYLGYLFEKTFFGKYPLDGDLFHKLIFTRKGEVMLDITLNRMDIDFMEVKNRVCSNDVEFFIKEERNKRIILYDKD